MISRQSMIITKSNGLTKITLSSESAGFASIKRSLLPLFQMACVSHSQMAHILICQLPILRFKHKKSWH